MPPPARATVEEIPDEDDPYAPYRPVRARRAGGPSSSASSSATSSRTSGRSSTSAPSTSYGADSTASDTYAASPSSGTQGTFPSSTGTEEPLFGGRPFRDSHNPAASSDKEYLYAILNVPADASAETIKDAYRSLAIILHPDKHGGDPARKAAAESRFREVQRAYEVLSDQEKRTIYDYFGEEGLKSSWSVVRRGRSREEMREEMERERRRREVTEAEALVKSKGDFTAHVDASSLFAPESRLRRAPPQQRSQLGQARAGAVVKQGNEGQAVAGGMVAPSAPFGRSVSFAERLSRVGCTQLIGKHGFETQVTNQTSATFSGQMVSRNGLGGGNLVGTLKTHWSPRLFTELTLSFLRPQMITTKGQFTVDANSFFTWQSTLQTLSLPPTLNLTYGQRLSSKSTLTGFTSVRSGTYALGPWGKDVGQMVRREPAAVAVGLTKQVGEGRGWTVQTSVSPVDQNISVDYALSVLSGVKVRTGFNVGTGSGLSAFTSAERRVTENVRLSLGLNCALPGGVTLRVKVNRLGQKILLPILLAPDFRSDLVVLFTAVPAAAYTALHWGYLEPRKQRRLRNRLGELRSVNAELIRERREAAVEAVAVLLETSKKKARGEGERRGLVVLEAWYGRREDLPSPTVAAEQAEEVWSNVTAPSASADVEEETVWDAKIPLQALVAKSQLIIPGGRSKSNLLGFHDPVMGEKKWLTVTYVFRDQLHRVTVADGEELAMPMRIHQV